MLVGVFDDRRVGEQRSKKVSAPARAAIFLKQQAGTLELVFLVDQPTEFLVSEVRIEVFVYGGVIPFFLKISNEVVKRPF